MARILTLFMPVILLFTLLPQTPAQARADGPADFTRSAKKAVSGALSGYALREKASLGGPSLLDRSQRVRIDSASFGSRGRVLTVVRVVGADREVTPKQVENGTVLGTVALPRPGAGVRQALLTSTADQWGPGLTILAWSERRGVNYQVVSRDSAGRAELVKVAKALRRDGSQATAKARTTIAKAKPAVPSPIDKMIKQPQAPNQGGVSAQGTGNQVVDGAGTLNDDLGNEATLCNGCAYWNGNFTGMWQHILYADNRLAYAKIDCQFGSTTATATASWQSSKGLAGDGIVGPNTRNKADNYLAAAGALVYYNGTHHKVDFCRCANGGYWYEFFVNEALIRYSRSGGTPPAC